MGAIDRALAAIFYVNIMCL